MTQSAEAQPIAASGPAAGIAQWLRAQATTPARLFVWLSLLFGLPLAFLTPPLRGADEPAHFLRAYGIAGGDLLPALRIDGRLGIHLPADLHADYSFFEDARYRFAESEVPYGETFAEYRRTKRHVGNEPVFVPYQGSEAYTPVAYLPYAAVALVGRIVGADFLSMLYGMRLMGLAASTAIIATAIAIAPGLRWPFLLIALLPSALYGRATINADGAAIALAILVAAFVLRAGARAMPQVAARQRAAWMTLCMLVKPSQLALAPIELLASRWPNIRWRIVAAVILPGLLLTCLWVYLTRAEIAVWRLTDNGLSAEQFAFGWKLRFMAESPGHFLDLLANSIWHQPPVLYQQLIGVLGWLDTPLHGWVYPLLGIALLVAMSDRLPLPIGPRGWIVTVGALTAVGYTAFVYFIFYVTWTPIDAEQIWGIQGRYFLPLLPSVAIAVAAALPARRTGSLAGPAAAAGALLSGVATLDAVWRVNW